MKIYLCYEDNLISGAFKNKQDAINQIRNKQFNNKRINYLKNAFNIVYTEEMIIEDINKRITEIELQ